MTSTPRSGAGLIGAETEMGSINQPEEALVPTQRSIGAAKAGAVQVEALSAGNYEDGLADSEYRPAYDGHQLDSFYYMKTSDNARGNPRAAVIVPRSRWCCGAMKLPPLTPLERIRRTTVNRSIELWRCKRSLPSTPSWLGYFAAARCTPVHFLRIRRRLYYHSSTLILFHPSGLNEATHGRDEGQSYDQDAGKMGKRGKRNSVFIVENKNLRGGTDMIVEMTFLGMILVEINKDSPLPVGLEMSQGCPTSDAWLLLRRLKSVTSRNLLQRSIEPIILSQ
ncbi:hypothetical protein KSP40_PGU015181 [Platanthera guangdongensis]|uniref:Uncharacterized protein n=1 Tax=Platanthera guangdongensis TaxID=2320717 RepID=A0ABR2LGF2_9ASPA